MNKNSCCVHFFLKFLHSVMAQVKHIPQDNISAPTFATETIPQQRDI